MVLEVASLQGCALPTVDDGRPPMAFYDTRLQYAILTGDGESLQKDFKMNPERSWVERGRSALTLPFAAAIDAAFFPVFYGLSSDLTD